VRAQRLTNPNDAVPLLAEHHMRVLHNIPFSLPFPLRVRVLRNLIHQVVGGDGGGCYYAAACFYMGSCKRCERSFMTVVFLYGCFYMGLCKRW
jgi:hypothetical protein